MDPLAGLPEGAVPLEYIISVKALDENGYVCLYTQRSGGCTPWEALGMAVSLADGLRAELVADDGGEGE
jgi:hypothetical protein